MAIKPTFDQISRFVQRAGEAVAALNQEAEAVGFPLRLDWKDAGELERPTSTVHPIFDHPLTNAKNGKSGAPGSTLTGAIAILKETGKPLSANAIWLLLQARGINVSKATVSSELSVGKKANRLRLLRDGTAFLWALPVGTPTSH